MVASALKSEFGSDTHVIRAAWLVVRVGTGLVEIAFTVQLFVKQIADAGIHVQVFGEFIFTTKPNTAYEPRSLVWCSVVSSPLNVYLRGFCLP